MNGYGPSLTGFSRKCTREPHQLRRYNPENNVQLFVILYYLLVYITYYIYYIYFLYKNYYIYFIYYLYNLLYIIYILLTSIYKKYYIDSQKQNFVIEISTVISVTCVKLIRLTDKNSIILAINFPVLKIAIKRLR